MVTRVLKLEGNDREKVDEKSGTIIYVTVFDEYEARKNYRRQGYGRQFVDLAENYLQEITVVKVARRFWEKLGYTSVTRDENYSKDL